MANIDDFDAPHEEADEHEEQPKEKGGIRKNIAAAWQASPVFKIFLLLVGGGAIASAALGVFSADKPKDVKSVVNRGPGITATPGGEAPPAFQQAVTDASKQRVQNAASQGGSALPTPMGDTTQMTALEPGQSSNDPLAEFRPPQQAQQQPQPQQQQPQQQAQQQPQQPARPTAPAEPPLDQNLANAMQQQMQSLVRGMEPAASKVIKISAADSKTDQGGSGQGGGDQQAQPQQQNVGKTLVPAGTINYAQMAIEANSDVPGPIMAQVLSGPFSGGRAIGQFQSTDDYLVMRFNNINFKGKDYPVNILALNPDTTLGAVASETDKRYLSRIIIPAAAQFVSGFSQAFTQDNSNVYIQDGVVISERTHAGLREGLAQGGQAAGSTAAGLIGQEASRIRPLVRVAVGTPIGLFFTTTVHENDPTATTGAANVNSPYALYNQQGGQANGYGAQAGYGNPYAANGQQGYQTGYQNGYAGQNPYQNGYSGGYQNSYQSNPYGSGINVIPAGGGTTPVIINR